MVTLDELNVLRQDEKWEEVLEKSREHIKTDPEASFALRAQAQALEKLDRLDEEYEGALYRLLELKDRVVETAQKLARYYIEKGEKEEAVRHLEIGLEQAVVERQYDTLEDMWLQLSELEPGLVDFFLRITEQLSAIKQHQRAAVLLQILLPSFEERNDWKGRFHLLKQILKLTPKDKTLREPLVETLKKMHPVPHMDLVLDYTGIRRDRPLPEALEEVELFINFLPGSFLRHPDWGIGKVKDLDMSKHRVLINFQRKRDHSMDVELAKKAVDPLAQDHFLVQRVVDPEGLLKKVREEPVEFFKMLLRSFGGSLSAKEVKEHLVPRVLNVREWTTWWSKTNSAVRRDPFISVTGGSAKRYVLRKQASSDEEELLQKFDETKAPHAKVDLILEYIRTTKKTDMHDHVLKHFSHKLHVMTPHRRSKTERVELWFTNEGLKKYCDKIESMPQEIIDDTLTDTQKAIRIMKKLRFKSHQNLYIERMKVVQQETWPTLFQQLLLEPDVQVRDELADTLIQEGKENLTLEVVDRVATEFRQFPHTFIWIAGRVLMHGETWLDGKLKKAVMIERLLLLVDYLTSQAKRREKEDAIWLRKVAGDARDLIRRDRYSLFKEYIKEADEGIAQSIYRRAQTNEGIDSRTATDLTTIVRARFPDLFSTVKEESVLPQGLLCLKTSLDRKKAAFKQLVEKELPEVVREIETARQHGDLKENAEYHAARDKQKLLATQTGELEEMLHQAQAVDLNQVQTDQIGFGVQFSITPVGSEHREEYVMLGPWESNPDKHILSYQAPFAMAFMGRKIGDPVEIDLPTHTGRYEILSIKPIEEDRLRSILEEKQTEGDLEVKDDSELMKV